MLLRLTVLLLVLLALAAAPAFARVHHNAPHAAKSVAPHSADPVGDDLWCIQFDTDVPNAAPILINVTRSWAPLGSDRMFALLKAGFFDVEPAAFFRIVPQFVVQFGISGSPAMNLQWENATILDDPVLQSNTANTVSFATAGPNTRTTQIFINTADNSGLDSQGFAPFGSVVSGMATVAQIFNPTPNDSNGVAQTQYAANGAVWIDKQYPGINSIVKATYVGGSCVV